MSILATARTGVPVALIMWGIATAQAADPTQCKKGAAGQEAVSACTAYIDSGTYQGWDLAAGYLYRAKGFQDLDKLDEAMADLQKANELRKPYPEGMGAMMLLKSRIKQKAEEARAKAANPEDCKPGAEGELAVNACTTLIEKGGLQGPELAQAYRIRAEGALNAGGEIAPAIDDLNKAIELDPSNHESYLVRGYYYMQFNKPDAALTDYNKAIELKPDSPWPYFQRGMRYYLPLKDYKAAIADLEQAQKIEPDNEDIKAYLLNVQDTMKRETQ